MLVECCVVWNTVLMDPLFLSDPDLGSENLWIRNREPTYLKKNYIKKNRKLTFKVFFCFVNKFASQ